MAIKFYETGKTKLEEQELHILDWCAYSLANEEKRACLDVIAKHDFGLAVRTTTIADVVGLDTDVVRNVLQNLSAVGILQRTGDNNSLHWAFTKESDWQVLRRICDIKESENLVARELTDEEGQDGDDGGFEHLVSSLEM
jgi:predicted transcriptional regulator